MTGGSTAGHPQRQLGFLLILTSGRSGAQGGDRRRGRGSFESNQWGLRGVVMLCREGWRRSSSQITLGFLVELPQQAVTTLVIQNDRKKPTALVDPLLIGYNKRPSCRIVTDQ